MRDDAYKTFKRKNGGWHDGAVGLAAACAIRPISSSGCSASGPASREMCQGWQQTMIQEFGLLPPGYETWMDFLPLSFGMAHLWPLQLFGVGRGSEPADGSFLSLFFSDTLPFK